MCTSVEGLEESRTGSRETTEGAGAVMKVAEDAASRRIRKIPWSRIQQVLGNLEEKEEAWSPSTVRFPTRLEIPSVFGRLIVEGG